MVIILLYSCPGPIPETPTFSAKISETGNIIHVDNQGQSQFTFTLDLGQAFYDVYYIFTNPLFYDASYPEVEAPASKAIVSSKSSIEPEPDTAASVSYEIALLNQKILSNLQNSPQQSISKSMYPMETIILADAVNDTAEFKDYDNTSLNEATCRYVSNPEIITPFEEKTLNIWVQNSCWEGAGMKSYEVTQAMVDYVAEKFLTPGTDNDIYDWVTNIFGEEWSSDHDHSNLITDDTNITILLADLMNDDVPTGGVLMGYFYRGNALIPSAEAPESNGRIMFLVDAVMLAYKEGGTWEGTDFWPQQIISTLAHEFQHMINFYQKGIKYDNSGSEIWLDEMLSLSTEDLVASKLGIDGPRGVAYNEPTAGFPYNSNGRLPYFIYFPDRPTASWGADSKDILDYSHKYAFGAYLMRNFGGAAFVQKVMDNGYTGTQAIEYAVNQAGKNYSFGQLLAKWSAAQLLSDSTAAPTDYRYNSGTWFNSTLGSISYNLGSINLYNYIYEGQIGPYYFNNSPVGAMDYPNFPRTSNFIYLAGNSLIGSISDSFNLPPGTTLTIVAKQK